MDNSKAKKDTKLFSCFENKKKKQDLQDQKFLKYLNVVYLNVLKMFQKLSKDFERKKKPLKAKSLLELDNLISMMWWLFLLSEKHLSKDFLPLLAQERKKMFEDFNLKVRRTCPDFLKELCLKFQIILT